MKNSIFLGGLMVLLSLSAQATLMDDLDGIDGVGSGITGFDATDITLAGAPDFSGVVTGASSVDFTVTFDFYAFGGVDYLNIYFEPVSASGSSDILDFSVTFSDLEWGGSEVLAGISLEYEDPDLGGAGLNPGLTASTLTLNFEDFLVPNGLREVELKLITEVDTGGGPSTPIPEPATIAILGLGLAGLSARRLTR